MPATAPGPDLPGASSDPTLPIPGWLRRGVVLLLAAWCILGTLHTAYVMVRPHGLIIRRAPGIARTIGLPGDEDSRSVVVILDLLAHAGEVAAGDEPTGAGTSDEAVLLIRPTGDERPYWDYLHFQLAQLAYPLRVDVVAAGSAPALGQSGYDLVIAPIGVPVGSGWGEQLAESGFALYTRVDP